MIQDRLKLHFGKNPFDFGYVLHVAIDETDKGGSLSIAKPLEFVGIDQGIALNPDKPALSLKAEQAQALMDEMWTAGVRPSNGEGNVGQIGALKDHLGDMRKIVEKQLKVDLS